MAIEDEGLVDAGDGIPDDDIVEDVGPQDVTEEPEALGPEEHPGEAGPGEAPEGVPEDAAPPPELSPPQVEPFYFRADGRHVDVQGAVRIRQTLPDGTEQRGIFIPEDTWQRGVQPYLADRGAWARQRTQYEKRMEGLSPERNPEVIQARVLLGELNKLLQGEPEEFEAFVGNFKANANQWRLLAENEKLKAVTQAASTELSSREVEERVNYVRYAIDTELAPQSQANLVAQYASQLGLDPATTARLKEYVWENRAMFYAEADEQVASQLGINPGDVYRRDDQLLKTIEFFVGSRPDPRTEEVRRKNERAVRRPSPPPQPKEARTTTATKAKEPDSWEDWLKSME